MNISNNSSSVARSCWKKYYWRYIEKLTPIRQSSALTLGKIIHKAFDLYYKGKPIKEVISYISKTFDDEIRQSSPEESEYLTIAKYTAIGMVAHNPYTSIQFERIESEKEFRIKLTRGVWFIGRVDGIVKKGGKWWLRELKTTSQTQRQFHQRSSISSQGTAYVWALRRDGYDVKGIMYDFIKKPLLRKRVQEDQYEFGSRILADYKKRKDFYYGQIFSYRSQQEIDLWEEDAVSLVKEVRSKRRHKRFYRNTLACYSYNSECPYKKICFESSPDVLMLQLYFKRDGKQINEKGGIDDETQTKN